jgi:hypothetical protein
MTIDVGIALAMRHYGEIDYNETVLATDVFGRPTEKEFRCQSVGPFTTTFFVANIAILTSLAYLCYKSRDIPVKFSESKYISVSVSSALQIICVGFLLIWLSDNTPTVDYLLISLMTIITDGSTLLLIFAPKIYLSMTSCEFEEGMRIEASSGFDNHYSPGTIIHRHIRHGKFDIRYALFHNAALHICTCLFIAVVFCVDLSLI